MKTLLTVYHAAFILLWVVLVYCTGNMFIHHPTPLNMVWVVGTLVCLVVRVWFALRFIEKGV